MSSNFHKFQGDSKFLYKMIKIPGYIQGSMSQNKCHAFQVFHWALGTL